MNSFRSVKSIDELLINYKKGLNLFKGLWGAGVGALSGGKIEAILGALEGVQIKDLMHAKENPESVVSRVIYKLYNALMENPDELIDYILARAEEEGLSTDDYVDQLLPEKGDTQPVIT